MSQRGPSDPAERVVYEQGRTVGMVIGSGVIILILVVILLALIF